MERRTDVLSLQESFKRSSELLDNIERLVDDLLAKQKKDSGITQEKRVTGRKTHLRLVTRR